MVDSLLLLVALASSADAPVPAPVSVLDWPVAATQVVAPTQYAKVTAKAPRTASPLDIVLRIVGPFEGTTQHVMQANEGGEAPARSRVTVVRDGLLDDAVRAMRWDILLDRRGTNGWSVSEVRHSWSCRRGAGAPRFDTVRCP